MRETVWDGTPLVAPPVPPSSPLISPAGVLALLAPKALTARARARQGERGRGVRLVVLGTLGLVFWGVLFAVVARVLGYFRGVPEIGALLAGKLLGVALLSFLSILLISNVITALGTFFLARDLDLVAAAPLDWLRVYLAKLLETGLHSSWMVALMAAPIFTAYGLVYDGGPLFPLVALGVLVPLLAIPSAIGATVTLLLVTVLPARRTRDILSVIAIMSAAAVVVLLRLMRPEQLARPEGFRSLVDFVAVLRAPSSPFLPSEWAQEAVMGWLTWRNDPLPLYLLWTTAAAAIVLGAALHRVLYRRAFSRAQEGANAAGGPSRAWSVLSWALNPLGPVRRELVLKELRLFFRDTTQWSQLILLVVLVIVYVFNIKLLPLRGDGINFFLANVIPFLNLALAGFVLASVAARFLFPGVSLEGRTLWLLRASPLAMRDLLWAKYWVGTLPLLVLAVGLVTATNLLLQVSTFMFFVTLGSIVALTFAIAGLAVGLGTLFPRYETESAAQIPTSFGGLIFMMAAVGVIGAVIVLEARPVYAYLSARWTGQAPTPLEMLVGFGLAGTVCVLAAILPLRAAVARLERPDA
jgi:ABC-2 type transport system permease protein